MKTRLLTLVAALAATASMAQTNQVLSRNAVGYEKITVSTNQLVLVRNDFNNLGGSPFTVTNLIGDQLPNGSAVLIWSRANQTYIGETRTRSGWTPGTNILQRGDGFFIRVPAVAPSNQFSVFLMGEVPDAVTAPSTTVANVTALGMFGFPYPVAMMWTNTSLGANAVSGDSLLLWDQAAQTYSGFTRTRSGWGAGTNVVLQPGQGFWFRTAATQQWTEVKPYTWP